MRRMRVRTLWPAGAMATGLIAGSVWAQAPLPVQPTGPAPPIVEHHGGPIRRFFHHTGRVLQDNLIGYPEEFIEPPAGALVGENFHMMRAKADPHKFTLYHSDFLDGTSRFSPTGAARFNLMVSRLPNWLGPVIIEWSPDRPGLAESRKAAVLATLQRANFPVVPERLLIAPSPYPGALGTDAANNYEIMITRDQAAPSGYSLTPTEEGTISSSGGG
jgi:hypothetical protein